MSEVMEGLITSGVPRLDRCSAVRFVGDLHLGDGGRSDVFGSKDALLLDFLDECMKASDAVVFMGDTFDLPQALTVGRILSARHGVVAAIRELSQHVPVVFLRGNRDWQVDYRALFPLASVHERIEVGDLLVLHGHQLDWLYRDGGRGRLALLRAVGLAERALGTSLRELAWRERADGPAYPLAALLQAFGFHLRLQAEIWRRFGLDWAARTLDVFATYWARAFEDDSDALLRPAATLARYEGCRGVVCGHSHVPGLTDLGDCLYVNTGSWTYASSQFAGWQDGRLSVHERASGETIGERHCRRMLAGEKSGESTDHSGYPAGARERADRPAERWIARYRMKQEAA